MYTQYGEHGMDGWDYSRALQVLGDCYLADYINLEECLDLSLPIAKKASECIYELGRTGRQLYIWICVLAE